MASVDRMSWDFAIRADQSIGCYRHCIWRCGRPGLVVMMEHQHIFMLLMEGVFVFKEGINSALEHECTGFVEDNGTDSVPIRGESPEDSHCLVFITEGVTKRTQLKSDVFHILNLHRYVILGLNVILPKLRSKHGHGC